MERERFTQANVLLLGFIAFIAALAVVCLLLEAVILPFALSEDWEATTVTKIPTAKDMMTSPVGWERQIRASESPLELNLSIDHVGYDPDDAFSVKVVSDGKSVESVECETPEGYKGGTFYCNVPLKYRYAEKSAYDIYPVRTRDDEESRTEPVKVYVDWRGYVSEFWSSSKYLTAIAAAGLAFCAMFVALLVFLARKTVHELAYNGEYSLKSIIRPFFGTKTGKERYWGFMSSAYFWAIEMAGITALIAYLALSSESFRSLEALYGFIISGMVALPIPVMVVALFWYSDYKEREPIPIMVSLMLWGGISCLLAMGLNDMVGGIMGAAGLGFMTALMVAPFFEEFFKGSGLVLFSLHHEFDDIVDGIVYGLTIGLGFTFVENWLYLLKNPVGASVSGWIIVLIMRSVFFGLNHGVFTACTGAVIGYLKQKGMSWAPYGLFIGMAPAMFLHFMHNMVTCVGALGPLGIVYVFTALPFFDYGAMALIMGIMAYGVYKAKSK